MAGVAVDAIFDSVSVGTTYKAKLAEAGIIFCSFGEAVREHPDWFGNTSAPWCRRATISLPRSTQRSLATDRSSLSPGAYDAHHGALFTYFPD